MNFNKDSIARTLVVAITLCVIASFFVSIAAVLLKENQDFNKLNEKKINILQAAGYVQVGEKVNPRKVDQFFQKIKISIIDFNSGEKIEGDVEKFDQLKMSKQLDQSMLLDKKTDIAGIKRRENQGLVYEVVESGQVTKIVIPIRGYGLWSTLYGFLALAKNGNDVKGITFYQHGETPGLGGEVDNPKWKSLWVDKKVFNQQGEVVIKVVRGGRTLESKNEVDAISGATITSRGVENMLHFWLSDMAYGKYLKKFFM